MAIKLRSQLSGIRFSEIRGGGISVDRDPSRKYMSVLFLRYAITCKASDFNS